MALFTIGDLSEKLGDGNMANLIKCLLAGFVTRDALLEFVMEKMEKVQNTFLQQTGNTQCGVCSTPNVIKCPTKGICSGRPCKFHFVDKYQPCTKDVCQTVRDFIVNLHRYSRPSWSNTNAKQWLLNPWELAKCFLPPDGYGDKHTARETDLNGIMALIINCREFETEFEDDLKEKTNICSKARKVLKMIRHAPETDLHEDSMFNFIQTLNNLLGNSKRLFGRTECQTAMCKLDEIKARGFNIKHEDTNRQQEVWYALKNLETRVDTLSTEIQEHDEGTQQLSDGAIETFRESYEQIKADFENELKTFYKKFKSSIPIYPLVPEVNETIENIYVVPNIIRLDHEKYERIPFHYRRSLNRSNSRDHLTLCDILLHKDKVVNEVYIEGEPGVGKTAFCIKIASTWASNQDHFTNTCNQFFPPETLSQFKFVFLVFLRDFNGRECNIEKMIKHHILSRLKTQYTCKFLKEILNEERCLVILDGLDEWRHKHGDDCECGAQKIIPFRRMLENCTVLTTTRPWKTAFARISENEIDRRFEIIGVKDPHDLVRKVIQCLNKRSGEKKLEQDFLKSIAVNNLTHFLDIPVLNKQLLRLWYKGGQLGTSVCETYRNIIDMLFGQVRICTSDGNIEQCQSNTNEDRNDSLLDKLGKLAFETFVNHERESSIVFDIAVVNTSLTAEESIRALLVGILTERPYILPNAQHSSVFSFLHKTFQEFLAARHIACITSKSDSDVKDLANLHQQMIKIQDIEVFFKFMCGINGHAAATFSESLMENISNDCEIQLQATGTENSILDLQNLCLIQQAQDLIIKGYREATNNQVDVELYLTHVTDRDIKTSGNMEVWNQHVQMNKCRMVSVYLTENHDQETTDLLKSVFIHSFDTLVYVTLKNQHAEVNLNQCTKLKYMCIENEAQHGKTTANTDSIVTCSLKHVSNQTELCMLSSLKNAQLLQNLHIHQCRNVEGFVSMLPYMPTLQRLKVCHVDFTKSKLTALPKSLKYVYFQEVTINAFTLERITMSFTESNHAVTFKLKDCLVIPHAEFEAFKQMIRSSQKYTVTKDGYKMADGNVFDGDEELYIFKYSLNPSKNQQSDDNDIEKQL